MHYDASRLPDDVRSAWTELLHSLDVEAFVRSRRHEWEVEDAVDFGLWMALSIDRYDIADEFLSGYRQIVQKEILPDDRFDPGPLHRVLERLEDRPAAVRWFLKQGADINRRSFGNDWTPLHHAAALGADETLKVLIEHGAEIDARTEIDGELTPLMEAASQGRLRCCQILVEAKCDIFARMTWTRQTALDLARSRGHRDLADYLNGLMRRS